MKKTILPITMGLLALASGCYTPKHSNVLIFATNTKLGVDISYDPKTQEPSLVVGFRRQEGVWMPLLANFGPDGLEPGPLTIKDGAGGAGDVQIAPQMLYQGKDDKNGSDTYSVLATFSGSGAANSSGTNGSAASGSIAQFFATGLAARELAHQGGAALVSTKALTPGQTSSYTNDGSSTLLQAYYTPKVSGTVTTTSASSTLVGSGTLFTKEVAVGDQIAVGGDFLKVTAIGNDTQLTAGANFTASKSGVQYVDYSASHQKALEDWLGSNEMADMPIQVLINGNLFSDARKKAVQDLKLQPQK